MPAARTSAAHRGIGRRSCVTLLAAFSAAMFAIGPGALSAMGADPQPPTPPATTQPSGSAPATGLTPDQQRVENVIAAAEQYVGVPYRVGSEGPLLFDCSGLVFRAFSDAGLVDRIGGARLRAAGYMRWFASRGMMTTDEAQAQRGDLVVYNNGSHIGIYLGDGRAISALINPFGVTVHSLHGVSLPVTGFLRPDWSGDGEVAPFVPVDLPDVPEVPVTLVPTVDWMPTLDPALSAPVVREGKEQVDMRTLNSRTYLNRDGTYTTEFHAQPIFFQPAGPSGAADLKPIDLTFAADADTGTASVSDSPVALTTRAADDPAGFLSATSGEYSVSLALATHAGMQSSKSAPQVLDGGRVVDFFDFQPQSVGLRVIAQPDGFKSFLVLGKLPDRNKFSFTLDAPGLFPVLADDGSIILNDDSGTTRGRIPRALLLDSSDIDGNGGGLFTSATSMSVDTSGAVPVITVAIDRSRLNEAVMPAYVDLSLTEFPQHASSADVTFASSTHPNAILNGFQRPESPGFDELWLGHQPSSQNNNDAFIRFDGLASVLGTVDVASASLEVLPYFQANQDGATLVRRITGDWSSDSLTWTTMPSADDPDAQSVTSASGTWSSLDVSAYVTDVVSRGMPDYGLVLSGDNSTKGTWKRLAASDAGATAEFGPRLVVTWSGQRPTAQPVAASDPGTAATLTWTQPQLAGAQARFEVQVSHDGFATVDADSGTVKGKLGKAQSWMLASGSLTSSGTYEWRVRARYGADGAWSEWSAPVSFDYALPAGFEIPHGAV